MSAFYHCVVNRGCETLQKSLFTPIRAGLSNLWRNEEHVLEDTFINSKKDWYSAVRAPSITANDINKQFRSFANQSTQFYKAYFKPEPSEQAKTWRESYKSATQFIKDSFNLVTSGYSALIRTPSKLSAEREAAIQYLPQKSRQALNAYWWTPGYWLNRFWNPKKIQLEESLLKAPSAIQIQQLKGELLALEAQYKNVKELNENPEIPGFAKIMLKYQCNRQLSEIKAKRTLLTVASSFIGKQLEAPKKALIDAYNNSNTLNPIKEGTVKAIKSGSIGKAFQTFQAERKDGTKVILRLIEPGLDEEFLDAHKPYLYFQELINQNNKDLDDFINDNFVANRVEAGVNTLKGKIRLVLGDENTKNSFSNTIRPVSSLEETEILARTEQGIVMPYVENKAFTSIPLS